MLYPFPHRFPDRIRHLLVALCLTASASAAQSSGDGAGDESASPEALIPLRPYTARYEARSRGLTSTATRRLRRDRTEDDITTYRLSQSLDVKVFGATLIDLEETSHFARTGNTLLASRYRYEQRGISRRSERLRFDWQDSTVLSTTRDGEQRFPLRAGALDQLAFTAQLRIHVQQAMEQESGRTEFVYRIMDEHGEDEHLYRLRERELLETPLGTLNTIRLDRIREPGSSRSTSVWLAPEHGYIMARLLQTEDGGPDTELLLKALEWTDT